MDVSYNELRNKDVVNLNDGSKMGRIIDIIIDCDSGRVLGFVVPGEKRLFKKSDDIIIPLEKVRRIGDDVILVRIELEGFMNKYTTKHSARGGKTTNSYSVKYKNNNGSFIKYRKLDNKKYK